MIGHYCYYTAYLDDFPFGTFSDGQSVIHHFRSGAVLCRAKLAHSQILLSTMPESNSAFLFQLTGSRLLCVLRLRLKVQAAGDNLLKLQNSDTTVGVATSVGGG